MMIWPHAAQSEYREPQLRFSLPSFLLVSDGEERAVYGFFWVSELYWIEVLGLICCELVLAALTGAVVYKLVVAPGKCGTSAAYLLGWGVLLPLWIAGPTSIDQVLNLRNLVFKFVVGGVIPTLTIFRLTEAIYGCTPHYATGSMSAFVVYFASVLVFERDEKTGTMLKATLHMAWLHFKQFLILLFTTGALQSMLTPHADMNLFGQPITSDGWLRIERLATWQLYANSFLHAGTRPKALFQLYLATYVEGLTFAWVVVTGYQTKPMMNNPLLRSQSPSDFWGRRWNLLVQNVLKGGVYKPARQLGFSPTTAVTATFLASGLFHEWLVHGIFSSSCSDRFQSNDSCFHPRYGGAIVFFLWQAFLVAGEFTVGNAKWVASLSQRLPLPIRTFLIIAMGIPLAHFFTEPYVRSNFFRHGQMGLPTILRLDGDS